MSEPGCEVLIVGAGPTGLSAAIALAHRGVRCRLIDAAEAPNPHSRALIVHARTLELLGFWGIASTLIRRGSPSLRLETWVAKKPAVQVNIPDLGITDSPYPLLLSVSQAETEAVLAAHARRLGVVASRPCRLVGFTQDPEGVSAEVQSPSGSETVRCRYLVGADGAHSVVRKVLGLSFEGGRYAQDFVVADVEVEGVPDDRVTLQLVRDRILAWFPLPTGMRLMTVREPCELEAGPPTLEELQARVDELSAYPAKLSGASWMSAFRLHHRGVDHYRRGRCFLAGDAAHIHSPAGGQGMNTGIQDAINLGWKLAQVVRDEAPPELLDSYEEERLPVGHKLLSFTDRAFSFFTSTNPLVWTLRDLAVGQVAPWLVASPERRARAFRFASQLGIRYRHSLLTRSAGASPHPGPGERLPDAQVADPNGADARLHHHLDGVRWLLLALVGPEAVAGELAAYDAQLEAALALWPNQATPLFVAPSAPVGAPLPRRLALDETGAVARLLAVRDHALVLLRPDGHIAWRGEGWDLGPLERWLAGWQLRQSGL